MLRRLVGSDLRRLVPTAALVGGALVLVADFVARNLRPGRSPGVAKYLAGARHAASWRVFGAAGRAVLSDTVANVTRSMTTHIPAAHTNGASAAGSGRAHRQRDPGRLRPARYPRRRRSAGAARRDHGAGRPERPGQSTLHGRSVPKPLSAARRCGDDRWPGHPAVEHAGYGAAPGYFATGSVAPANLTVRDLVEQGRYAQVGPFRMLQRQDHAAIARAIGLVGLNQLADRDVDTPRAASARGPGWRWRWRRRRPSWHLMSRPPFLISATSSKCSSWSSAQPGARADGADGAARPEPRGVVRRRHGGAGRRRDRGGGASPGARSYSRICCAIVFGVVASVIRDPYSGKPSDRGAQLGLTKT